VIADNTQSILKIAEEIAGRLAFPLELVDVGGGFGIPYFTDYNSEPQLDVAKMREILEVPVRAFAERHPRTRIVAESGRFLAAGCGLLVLQVMSTKINHGSAFAVVNGGINSFFLTADQLASQKPGEPNRNFPFRRLGENANGEEAVTYSICGPAPTPSDLIGRAVKLPRLERGDYLCVAYAGAYGPTASLPLFIGSGAPAEVFLHRGKTSLVRERDQFIDLLRKQNPLVFEASDFSTFDGNWAIGTTC